MKGEALLATDRCNEVLHANVEERKPDGSWQLVTKIVVSSTEHVRKGGTDKV